MTQALFSPDELVLLKEIAHVEYQNLREEIVKTEGSHYKDLLKSRERALAGLIEKLNGLEDASDAKAKQ